MGFDYKEYLKRVAHEEETRPKREVSREALTSSDRSVWQEVFPQYHHVFEKPELACQFRQQPAPAIEQVQRFSHVLIPLPPFKDANLFLNYFARPLSVVGSKPTEKEVEQAQKLLVKAIKSGTLVPFLLEPEQYENQAVRKLYKPVFKELDTLGIYPPYANRVEDFLSKKKRSGMSWEERKFNRRKGLALLKDKPINFLGILAPQPADVYLGERMAWLDLLGMGHEAEDLRKIAIEHGKWQEAGLIAFMFHTFYIGPVFYSRNTVTCVCPDVDIPILEQAAKIFLHFRKTGDIGSEEIVRLEPEIVWPLGATLGPSEQIQGPASLRWVTPYTFKGYHNLLEKVDTDLRDRNLRQEQALRDDIRSGDIEGSAAIERLRTLRQQVNEKVEGIHPAGEHVHMNIKCAIATTIDMSLRISSLKLSTEAVPPPALIYAFAYRWAERSRPLIDFLGHRWDRWRNPHLKLSPDWTLLPPTRQWR